MTTRVALYARYSSDLQREASIEDQLRLCREHGAREAWAIAGSYHDAGISGASLVLRPGIQQLLRDAQAGRFEIVLAEALDRLSRDQADVATLYKQLKFCGVAIVTLAEGAISELHVGLKGTMNALFLKDLALKTRRGLRGRVEAGKSGGGLCYGYRVVKKLDANGEASKGGREIVPQEAEVIRRIFRDFAAGVSPRTIAKSLNEQGIPGPAGRLWNDTTIRGHVRRGTGIVNNELYIGKLVWNRQRYVKDPATGRRVSRLYPEGEWIVAHVPELRIVDEALWQAVRVRQDDIADKHLKLTAAVRAHHQRNRLAGALRPKSLLSGLIICGRCGGPYSLRSVDRFACSSHSSNGACANTRTIPRAELEQRVLAGLKERMMAPEAAAAAMRAYAEESNRLNRERRANAATWTVDLVQVEKQIRSLIEAIKAGMFQASMKAALDGFEARQAELTELLAATPQDLPELLPSISTVYAKKVAHLTEALNHADDRQEAAQALRALIAKIVLTPGVKRGEMEATLHGSWARCSVGLSGRPEITPPNKNTPGAGLAGVF
ncbi:recombinase family protein [Mesorhizobium soli]|uniref:Recombinase family protein n=2 Tax=Pseudaminobacter soli (ex Li et al. 2025) TaxID=1295366 RepID=A0A2P7S3Y5_9HYPH|nr:recombinase family protein [Mesorhizobium soli]